MTEIRSLLGTALALLILPTASECATGEKTDLHDIIVDQNGLTLSTSTVSPGKIQSEMRFGFYSAGIGNHFVLPDLLIRLGIVKKWELRIAPPSVVIHSRDGLNGPRRNGGERGIYPLGNRSEKRPMSFTLHHTNLVLGTKGIWPVTDKWHAGFAALLGLPIHDVQVRSWLIVASALGILGLRLNDLAFLEGNLALNFIGPGLSGEKWKRTYSASLKLRGFLSRNRQFDYYVEVYSVLFEHDLPYPILDFGFGARIAEKWTLGTFFGAGLLQIQRLLDIFVGLSAAIRL